MAKKNNWGADAMQGTLISDMEQEVRDGVSQMSVSSGSAAGNTATLPDGSPSGVQQEPTKGVQTYIPISQYMRLSNQKLKRDMENGMMNSKMKTTIATLVAEAISLWLDVQDGKLKVT